MKKQLLVVVMVLVAACANAQTFIPKAGITLSKIVFDESEGVKSKLGLTLGVAYNIGVNEMFSVQPELNFVQKGFKIDRSISIFGESFSIEGEETINYLELPVLAKISFGDDTKFFLNAGPSLAFGLGGKYESEYTFTYGTDSFSEKLDGKVKFGKEPNNYEGDDTYIDNRIDFGLQIGGGVILGSKIMLDVRYGLGLSNLYDKADDEDNKSQNRVLQFTVGIPLGGK